MRNYVYIDDYLNRLATDVYEQPPDPGHQAAIEGIVNQWLPNIEPLQRESILDVGCAQGQALPILAQYAETVDGVTLGRDAAIAHERGHKVRQADFSFLPFPAESFDLIFARHVLEHSPMPLLTLMEWHRVAKHFLLLILPTYRHYRAQGQNHYYVLLPDQWEQLLHRAGWDIIWTDRSRELIAPFEHRWLCGKKET